MVARPLLNGRPAPHLAHGQRVVRRGKLRVGGDLLYPLAADAEQFGDLLGAHEAACVWRHGVHSTLRLTTSHMTSRFINMSTTEHTAKCLNCGRIRHFRSAEAAAKAAPSGRICRAKIRLAMLNEAVRGFAAAQIDKARELIADGGLIPTGRSGVFRAVSSKGDDTYLTHPATCSCAAARRGKATPCYHSLAARLVMATGKVA